jgi:peroxiredoxin
MRTVLALALALLGVQTPVDVSKVGPQVGATVADFTLKDQRGQDQSLAKVAGPKGTMLVLFRSADW